MQLLRLDQGAPSILKVFSKTFYEDNRLPTATRNWGLSVNSPLLDEESTGRLLFDIDVLVLQLFKIAFEKESNVNFMVEKKTRRGGHA